MDASGSQDPAIPVQEQAAENDEADPDVIIVDIPMLSADNKKRKRRSNRNEKPGAKTLKRHSEDVCDTSDSFQSPAIPLEESATQDQKSDSPGTSATVDLALAPAVEKQQLNPHKISDEAMDSQQVKKHDPETSTPIKEFLQNLVVKYEDELAYMLEELNRVQNPDSESDD